MGGASAGAASVLFQLTAFGGRDDGLFHAAAAQSASMGPTMTVNESQHQYNALVRRLQCDKAGDTLACLRTKPAIEVQKQHRDVPYPGAQKPPVFMYHPVIDDDFIRKSPCASLEDGSFVKVPTFFGDDTNGGTVSAPKMTNTLKQSDTFLSNNYPALELTHLDTIHSLYPQTDDHFKGSGPYWRQLSNVYGDMRYMCPSMFISDALSQHNVSANWNYRYNVENKQLMHSGLGVPHVSENRALWAPSSLAGDPKGKTWEHYTTYNKNIVPVIQGYWTSFIRSYDPNTYRCHGCPRWEEWTTAGKQRLVFETNKTRMEVVDDVTQKRCAFLSSIAIDIQQ